LVLLAPFFVWAALVAVLLGLPLLITGIVIVYLLFKEMGKETEMDAIRGPGAGWAVMVLQIVYAFKKPRLLGP
jgi:hypothetical protein